MLSRNIGFAILVFSLVMSGLTIANLVFLTNLKSAVVGTKYSSLNVNAYLAITSVVFVLTLLSFALGVILVVPESRLQRTPPEPLLDL